MGIRLRMEGVFGRKNEASLSKRLGAGRKDRKNNSIPNLYPLLRSHSQIRSRRVFSPTTQDSDWVGQIFSIMSDCSTCAQIEVQRYEQARSRKNGAGVHRFTLYAQSRDLA